MLHKLKALFQALAPLPPLKYRTVVPIGNMADAYARLDAGEFGHYHSDLTIDNLHYWGPDGRTLGPTTPVTLGFSDRGAAMRFKLIFG